MKLKIKLLLIMIIINILHKKVTSNKTSHTEFNTKLDDLEKQQI